jgi:hypothetical protein
MLPADPPRPRTTRAPSPRPRPHRPPVGYAVAAPGLYVWEATAREAEWAHELARFAAALERTRQG